MLKLLLLEHGVLKERLRMLGIVHVTASVLIANSLVQLLHLRLPQRRPVALIRRSDPRDRNNLHALCRA